MNQVFSLLKPRWWSFRSRRFEKRGDTRNLIFFAVGFIFWVGIFVVSYRMLSYFQQVEDFGDILAYKLLSMVLLIFFSLLIFSSIITALSKLYLSQDLSLLHTLPVPREKIFLARWLESTLDASWMVIAYTIPVLITYGVVYETGLFYYANILFAILPLVITASSLSALIVLVTVIILPAGRIRSVFIFIGLLVFIVLYIAFRMLRPERLVDPDAFATMLIYLESIGTPSSPLLPSTWAFDALKAALAGDLNTALFHDALSWSAAFFLISVNLVVARLIYFKGFSKTQAAVVRLFSSHKQKLRSVFAFLPGPSRAFIVKEIKTFWRDQTQWSQIFLVVALIAIYLYNFSVLPLEKAPIKTIYLQNLFSFLNMALAAFVLTSVAARFAYPSVSIEAQSFWIVQSGPISIRTFLWIKFFIYLVPLIILSEILIVATNILLHVTPFMMGLSTITLLVMTPGVIAMGIGLGAAYPNFSAENAAQSVTSFGGLMFMILSAAYIGAVTILEAGPVYAIFMAGMRGDHLSMLQLLWTIISFAIVLVLSVLAVFLPMRYGELKLKLLASQEDV